MLPAKGGSIFFIPAILRDRQNKSRLLHLSAKVTPMNRQGNRCAVKSCSASGCAKPKQPMQSFLFLIVALAALPFASFVVPPLFASGASQSSAVCHTPCSSQALRHSGTYASLAKLADHKAQHT